VSTESGGAFFVAVEHVAGTTVIAVTGEVDMLTVCQLDDRMPRADDLAGPLVLDLSRVTFFGSAGVARLVAVQNRGVDLRLVCSPAVTRVLELTGVVDMFRFHDSVSDALA
jgi:anti-sigma B factor antagonist